MTGMDAKGPGSLPAGSEGRRAREIERRKRRHRPSLDGLEARVAPASGFAAGLPVAARYAVSESFGSRDASYAATDDGGAIVLANAANAYDATVGPGGFRIVSGADSWSLSVRGLGYGEDVRPLGAATVSTDTNRVEYDHGAVTQWYVNGPLGLQQGFTLDARPEGSDLGGPLTIVLGVDGLVVAPEPGGTSVALVRGDGSTAASYGGLIAYDAAGRSVPATMSVDSGGSIAIRVDDAGAAYPLVVDPFVARARLPVDSSEFAMSADGRTLVVGQQFFGEGPESFRAGAVFVYDRVGETWVETARIQPDVPVAQGWFGLSTALSGDGSTLFVGAERARPDAPRRGAVYVFARTDDGWDQVQVIEPGPDGRGHFGATLATNADGGVVAIPDFRHGQEPTGGPGVIWIYARFGSTWAPEAGFGASAETPSLFDHGPSLDFDAAGTTLVVGVPFESSFAGQTYLFTKEAVGWTRSLLTGVDPGLAGSTRRLGERVALSDDGSTLLVASAPSSETNESTRFAIRTYRRSGAGWDYTGDLPFPTGPGAVDGDATLAVDADGATAVARARSTGYAYVFRKQAGAWVHLTTFQPHNNSRLSLAFAGDLLAVGSDVSSVSDPATGGLRIYAYEPGFEVTAQPADVVAIAGRPATFAAEAGAPGLLAVWQELDQAGVWTDLAGGETATIGGRTQSWYTATTPQIADRRFYRVVFTDPETGQVLASFPATLRNRWAEVTVTVEPSRPTIRVGEPATLTIRVTSGSPGLPAPTGRIDVGLGSAPFGRADLVDGRAVVEIPNTLRAGEYPVSAWYSGDGVHEAMNSLEFTFVVERRAGTLTAEIPAETVAGRPTTLTAILSALDLPLEPSGGVVFLDRGQPIGFIPAVAATGGGTAAFTTASLSVGDHYIQLVYLGDPKTAAASSGVYKITVRPAGATATPGLAPPLAGTVAPPANADPSPTLPAPTESEAAGVRSVGVGEEVTFTIPEGSVFAAIQWQASDDQGATWQDVPGATAAWHRLIASGDDSGRWFRALLIDDEGASVAAPAEALEVVRRPTRLFPSTQPQRPVVGSDFQIVVRAFPVALIGRPAPSGSLTLTLGTFTQTVTIVGGWATFTVPAIAAPGMRIARLTYDGDADFDAASIQVPLFVGRRAPELYAAVPPSATSPEGPEVILAVVAREALGAPTGGVMVLDGGRPIALLPLADAGLYSEARSTLRLAPGVHYLQFVYLGDPRTLMVSSRVYQVEVRAATPQAKSATPAAAATMNDGPAPSKAPAPRVVSKAAATIASPAPAVVPTGPPSAIPAPSPPRGGASAFATRSRILRAAAPTPLIRPRPRAVDPGAWVRVRIGGASGPA